MKPIKGECSGCGRDGWLAHNAKKLCRFCNEKRKRDLKKKKAEFLGDDISEADMYREIWSARPHVSWLTGKNLDEYYDTPKWYSLFAHVCNKGAYTKYKFNRENIILLTPFEHLLLDQGTEEARLRYANKEKCDWNRLYELRDRLKEQYRQEYGMR